MEEIEVTEKIIEEGIRYLHESVIFEGSWGSLEIDLVVEIYTKMAKASQGFSHFRIVDK